MRIFALSILLITVAGCAPSAQELEPARDDPRPRSAPVDIPADASGVASRLASCIHFSGEFNGDQSERDKEISAAMTELRCDTIESEAAEIRRKYPGNAAVTRVLESADDL